VPPPVPILDQMPVRSLGLVRADPVDLSGRRRYLVVVPVVDRIDQHAVINRHTHQHVRVNHLRPGIDTGAQRLGQFLAAQLPQAILEVALDAEGDVIHPSLPPTATARSIYSFPSSSGNTARMS